MGNRNNIFVYILPLVFIFFACEGKKEVVPGAETRASGRIIISVDESFKPVIEQQVAVFESLYPEAEIVVHYKPEADCIRDFLTDSIRMVVITRRASEEEENLVLDSLKLIVSQMVVAKDAIAVIVPPGSPDSVFTMEEIRQLLTGRYNKTLIPVFDGLKATSTVRFIVDSVLRELPLTSTAVAARSSQEVIDYVSATPGTVGFIGVSWVGNQEDPQQQSFLKKVKLARLQTRDTTGNYIWPVPINIYLKRYPLVRDLVYVLKENKRTGLGHGFSDFMSGEKGQLIFKRAYLVPAQMDFILRSAALTEETQ